MEVDEDHERLDGLHTADESDDGIVTELIDIYEAEKLAPSHAGDEV